MSNNLKILETEHCVRLLLYLYCDAYRSDELCVRTGFLMDTIWNFHFLSSMFNALHCFRFFICFIKWLFVVILKCVNCYGQLQMWRCSWWKEPLKTVTPYHSKQTLAPQYTFIYHNSWSRKVNSQLKRTLRLLLFNTLREKWFPLSSGKPVNC